MQALTFLDFQPGGRARAISRLLDETEGLFPCRAVPGVLAGADAGDVVLRERDDRHAPPAGVGGVEPDGYVVVPVFETAPPGETSGQGVHIGREDVQEECLPFVGRGTRRLLITYKTQQMASFSPSFPRKRESRDFRD